MRVRLAVVALGLAAPIWRAPAAAQEHADWHGYVQVRFTQGNDLSTFTVRRAKLWAEGPAPAGTHLHFKVQGLFRPADAGAFVLQDVYAEYRWASGSVRAGQMVPDLTLQRQQPDYAIPLVERAAVINTLVPAATTMARDIGTQLTIGHAGGLWHVSVGLFNGNGANHLSNDDQRFLVTARASCALALPHAVHLAFGGSVAHRRSSGMDLSGILGSGALPVERDTRWGVESRLTGARWDVQGEFLRATLDGVTARGWYGLAAYAIAQKNQLVVSVQQLHVPNPALARNPWYVVGVNHSFAGDQAKVMLDGRAEFTDPGTDWAAAAQFQIFFH